MRRLLPALAFLLLLLPACRRPTSEPDLAGDDVGRYVMEATLTENECGAGHPAPALLSYIVDLRHLEGSSRGYWKLPDGPQVEGVLERDTGFRFTGRTQGVAIPEDMAAGVPGCTLERTEIIEGTFSGSEEEPLDGGSTEPLDGGSAVPEAGVTTAQPESRLEGLTRVVVTAAAGGNCQALLTVYGGQFSDLPCRIEYDLVGERMDAAAP